MSEAICNGKRSTNPEPTVEALEQGASDFVAAVTSASAFNNLLWTASRLGGRLIV
jgi:hypothetical protein